MNWFKRMVVNWVKDDWNHTRMDQDICVSPKSGRNEPSTEPTLHFKVYSAIGGKVVEFSRYDRQSDRAEHQIYIIGKDEDFGEKIAKISTFEVLK
jgi:hypothetical protein